jgi:hypothetical protein
LQPYILKSFGKLLRLVLPPCFFLYRDELSSLLLPWDQGLYFQKKLRDRKFSANQWRSFKQNPPILDKKIERKYLHSLSEFWKCGPWSPLQIVTSCVAFVIFLTNLRRFFSYLI